MTDPQAARAAGLTMPQKSDCMNCHKVKGSHVAVLKVKTYDVDAGLGAAETPDSREMGSCMGEPTFPEPTDAQAPKHVGSIKCAECHKAPEMGYQYSKWRLSSHALAYAKLGTERAREIAKESGVQGDPLTDPSCLKCHTTIYYNPAGGHLDSYTARRRSRLRGLSRCRQRVRRGSRHAG